MIISDDIREISFLIFLLYLTDHFLIILSDRARARLFVNFPSARQTLVILCISAKAQSQITRRNRFLRVAVMKLSVSFFACLRFPAEIDPQRDAFEIVDYLPLRFQNTRFVLLFA